jgi:hypothetical protein
LKFWLENSYEGVMQPGMIFTIGILIFHFWHSPKKIIQFKLNSSSIVYCDMLQNLLYVLESPMLKYWVINWRWWPKIESGLLASNTPFSSLQTLWKYSLSSRNWMKPVNDDLFNQKLTHCKGQELYERCSHI